MLQDFRESISGAAKFIVILIAIPFVFFGVESIFLSGASVEEAASVDGEQIMRLEVQRAVLQRRSQLRRQYGELDPAVLSDDLLYSPVLQNMVNAKVLENQARARNMGVASETITDLLKSVEIFQLDGQFSKENYLAYLAQNQYTPKTHRRFLENEFLVNQLAQGIVNTSFVTDVELGQIMVLSEQARDFHYLTLSIAPIIEAVEIGEIEIEEYYKAHTNEFIAPETATVDYLELKVSELEKTLDLDESTLQKYYDEQLREAEASRKLFLGHVLVETRENGSHQEKLANAEAELKGGEEFAVVARQYSEDYLTVEQGGDMGQYLPEEFPDAFRSVVAALEVGEISSPIETDMGWHIIKVLREEKTLVGSLEEERVRIEAELRGELALDLMLEQSERLGDLAYDSASLAEVAEAMGLNLQTSMPLTRSVGEGIGGYPVVLGAIFGEDVLENGYASEVLELGEGHVIVVKLKEHQPERAQTLEEVRVQLEGLVKTNKAEQELQENAKTYIEAISAGQTVEQVASEYGLQWQVSLDTKRYAQGVNREVAERIFDVPASSILPVTGSFVAGAGDVVVYSLNAIRNGESGDLPPEQQSAMRSSLARTRAARELNMYQQSLVVSADIDIVPFLGADQ